MEQFTTSVILDGKTYDDIVAHGHPMDPETEDIVYSDDLRDGMVVILHAQDRLMVSNSYTPNAILATNRWCTVTRLRVDETVTEVIEGETTDASLHRRFRRTPILGDKVEELAAMEKIDKIPMMQKHFPIEKWPSESARQVVRKTITFIGVYSDGQKVVRNTNPNVGWVVKKDSIPQGRTPAHDPGA